VWSKFLNFVETWREMGEAEVKSCMTSSGFVEKRCVGM